MSGPAIPAGGFGPRLAQPLDHLVDDARNVLEGLYAKPDPKDMPPLARAAIEAAEQIKAIAARKFGDGEGRLLLEALCDATIRRPLIMVAPGMSLEQAALYAAKREGQNETLYMLLAMIAEGRGEPSPQRGS